MTPGPVQTGDVLSVLGSIPLNGQWSCELDRGDVGVAEEWFRRRGAGSAFLPGSLAAQGIGDAVTVDTSWTGTIFDRSYFDSPAHAEHRRPGNVKVPFWLQPETYYVGAAWYQRDVDIPAAWSGRRLVLTLERPHWFTRVWLDDREVGTGDSLSTPHRFELGNDTSEGRRRLTIQVDNRVRVAVGENAHSISDHTQGNWNGIIGRIEISAHRSAWFEDLQIVPNVAARSVRISGTVGGKSGCLLNLGIPSATVKAISLPAAGAFALEYPLGPNALLWDEFDPALHELTATLLDGNLVVDERTLQFGLREIATEGTEFRLNGRPLFFRGALECCVFPLTGHPPTEVETWRRALQTVKDHGLNHVRFHSWCPPEAAFVAGDELGVYFQVEAATWPNAVAVEAGQSPAGIGDGNSVDDWVYAETERILREYGNHPCFVLMAAGNEPGGPDHAHYLNAWVKHFRERDPRRLYTGAAGWPELAENEFHVIPEPRSHQWGDGLRSRLNGQPPATMMDYRQSIARRSVPVISHEIGQWCSYPPLDDVSKYTGRLKARNYEIFAETLSAAGMEAQLAAFVRASGKLQALCYKEEIESALRTPGMGGFQLLDLRDFPGQGTAPVGVLNALWESKGYISAPEFRRFCAPTVLLARLPKRVFTNRETLCAGIEVAHFGPAALEEVVVSWRVTEDDGAVLCSGRLPSQRLRCGAGIPVGEVSVELSAITKPGCFRLIAQIEEPAITNDWKFWVYPDQLEETAPTGVTVLRAWNAEAQEILHKCGSVLLLLGSSAEGPDAIQLGFTPIFWNTWCTRRQAPHTLGILCDPGQPALAAFPTDVHTDWQWWYVLQHASAMNLDGLPRPLRPIVQIIDDWYANRRLGLLFEAQVGPGRLLVSSIDLVDPKDPNPVLRQLRHSILTYMDGPRFQPGIRLSMAELSSFVRAQGGGKVPPAGLA